jgi:hypothetical protein
MCDIGYEEEEQRVEEEELQEGEWKEEERRTEEEERREEDEIFSDIEYAAMEYYKNNTDPKRRLLYVLSKFAIIAKYTRLKAVDICKRADKISKAQDEKTKSPKKIKQKQRKYMRLLKKFDIALRSIYVTCIYGMSKGCYPYHIHTYTDSDIVKLKTKIKKHTMAGIEFCKKRIDNICERLEESSVSACCFYPTPRKRTKIEDDIKNQQTYLENLKKATKKLGIQVKDIIRTTRVP